MGKKVALGFYALALISLLYFMSYPIPTSYPPIPCNTSLPVSCAFQANPLDYLFPAAIFIAGIFIQVYGGRIEGES